MMTEIYTIDGGHKEALFRGANIKKVIQLKILQEAVIEDNCNHETCVQKF